MDSRGDRPEQPGLTPLATGSVVFPGLQNYDSLYSFQESNDSSQPIDLSNASKNNKQNSSFNPVIPSTSLIPPVTHKQKVRYKYGKPDTLPSSKIFPVTNILPSKSQINQTFPSSTSHLTVAPVAASKVTNQLSNTSQKMILFMQPTPQKSSPPLALLVNQGPFAGSQVIGQPARVKMESPHIQAVLNKPPKVTPHTTSQNFAETASFTNISSMVGQQAPTMVHFLNAPPLMISSQSSVPMHKLAIEKEKPRAITTNLKPILPADMHPSCSNSSDRFIKAERIPCDQNNSPVLHNPPTSIFDGNMKFQPVSVSEFVIAPKANSNDMRHNHSQDNFTVVPAADLLHSAKPDDTVFNPIDLRTLDGHKLETDENTRPAYPRSVIESRIYHKKKNKPHQNNNLPKPSYRSTDECSSMSMSNHEEQKPACDTGFDWTTYLSATNTRAAPHSAFKHVEASLVNGYQVGMKVETPLRDADTDKYWLATIVAVYGSLLKLRFDGYGDDSSDDFLSLSSSDIIHPIGWCSKNQKSLLPPIAIRHTQKHWKNFLLKALQGAKNIPSCSRPWAADRIRPGMRLEVQHLDCPAAVWLAKVIRNVGGRLKLRYEGSIDASTDFWLFYRDHRIHYCNWASTFGCIYRPPTEIKDAFEYETWSEILINISKDPSIERLPQELLHGRDPIPPHRMLLNSAVEVVHPSGLFIFPATVSQLINERYYVVTMLSESNGVNPQRFSMCCYGGSPYVLPARWCSRHGVKLQTSVDHEIFDPNKFWDEHISSQNLITPEANSIKTEQPYHYFEPGQMLEVVSPEDPEVICLGQIHKIIDRLMWIKILSEDKITTTICDISSQSIFPAGWAESNDYPLCTPKLEYDAISLLAGLDGEFCPKIYFNRCCFSGPHLSKGRIAKLPTSMGPGPIEQVLTKVIRNLVDVGYKASRTLKVIQLRGEPDPKMSTIVINARKNHKPFKSHKSGEGLVQICSEKSQVPEFLKIICAKLECCPNLVSLVPVKDLCPEACYNQTKTQYLYIERGSAKHSGKKKKRKKRKHLFNPRRSFYLQKPASVSDNGSVSSNNDEDDSPDWKIPNLPSGSAESPKSMTAVAVNDSVEEEKADIMTESPLYQLQLTSVQKQSSPGVPHYQVVKRKRGRPPKTSTSELDKNGSLPALRGPLTVPPLKIRRMDLSPHSPALDISTPNFSVPLSSTFPTTESVGINALPPSLIVVPVVSTSSITNSNINVTTSSPLTTVLPITLHVQTTRPPRTLAPKAPNPVINASSTAAVAPSQPITLILPNSLPNSVVSHNGDINGNSPKPEKSSEDTGLLKTTHLHPETQSALAFTRMRLHIEEKDKVKLTDNPLYWDVNKVVSFIKDTDCAGLADVLAENDIDGQAFMMLVLPTVQEELELKLGPALKLCHHVQRLKLAFFEKFFPYE